jgi:anaerobic magnesium-protoporphyrin IX monomethyl ester cyclase
MKVLLVNPPYKIFPGPMTVQVGQSGMPLGLLYVAAALEQADYEVEILNTHLDCRRPRHKQDSLVRGMTWQDIEKEIGDREPDLVGITNHFSAQIETTLAVAQIVKKINPKIPTIIGGPHPTFRYKQLLEENSDVDMVVIGEGELTIVDLMRAYSEGGDLSGVKGIAYRRDGQVRVNPRREFIADLDSLPLPAYHLIDMEGYFNQKDVRDSSNEPFQGIPMITSRGCPFNCVFCSTHVLAGRKWRAHSAEYIINHIDVVLNKYGVKHIHFDDDNFPLDINRLDSILNGLQERGLRFTWDSRGIRADSLTLPLLQKMKDCGCTYLGIGVESGEQEVLDKIINKRLRLEDVVKTADMCHRVGVGLVANYIVGFPGEKKENMRKTVDFALWLKKKYDVGMLIFVATPMPGSRLLDICEEKGYLAAELTPQSLSPGLQTLDYGLIKTGDFDINDVKKIVLQAQRTYRRLNLQNYLMHPITTIRKVLANPKNAMNYLNSLARL